MTDGVLLACLLCLGIMYALMQLDATAASLQQLQAEHAELTQALIEAKVSIAEKEGGCTLLFTCATGCLESRMRV